MQYGACSDRDRNAHAHQTVGSKKLKCSGEQPACSRCIRESIRCVYSLQKQMGRPKKRQRAENEADEEAIAGDLPLDQFLAGPADVISHSRDAIPPTDFNHVDPMFALDGMLQPWTVPGLDWSMNANVFDDSAPDLTRDNSSEDSPPALDIPTELQNSHQHQAPVSVNHTADFSAPDQLPTCACLSTLYLTLSNLATMDPAFSFPTALHPLREAMSTATQVLSCPTCPTRFITGLQNVQLLNALLMSLAERFSRVLTSITNEATSLEQHNASASPSEQKSKPFRLADLSTPGHLHTGGLGCAAAFSLSFTPAEWRSMTKKVVRAEVHGPSDGTNCCAYLLGLITAMEKRQDQWHKNPPPLDFPKDSNGITMSRSFGAGEGAAGHVTEGHGLPAYGGGEHLCLKMLEGTRRMVDTFDWS